MTSLYFKIPAKQTVPYGSFFIQQQSNNLVYSNKLLLGLGIFFFFFCYNWLANRFL